MRCITLFAAGLALALSGCGNPDPPTAPPPPEKVKVVPRELTGTPLEKVSAAVEMLVKTGETPIVVFDLDGTIFDNRPRTLKVLRDFATKQKPRSQPAEKLLKELDVDDVAYRVEDTLARIEIDDEEFIREAGRFWSNVFFSDTYTLFDEALPGAAKFARDLHRKGAWIVYLTARARDNSFNATTRTLNESGFPIGTSRTMLIMRDDMRGKDTRYKQDMFGELEKIGTVVAEFENEPRNANAYHEAFPDAVHILIDTPRSNDGVEPHKDIHWIKSFESAPPANENR